MAGGVGCNSVPHKILLSPRSSLHRVSSPQSVFQDVQGVTAALTLNFLNQSRVQIFPRYSGQAPVHNA